MICLVGEQPLPNLLPVRYEEPEHVVLAYTQSTREVSDRLEKVLRGEALVYPLEVLPFNIPAIRSALEEFIAGRGWKSAQLVFNLTGGTKAMAFAAYSLAEEWRSRFIYLESEESTSQLYRYRFDWDGTALSDGESIVPDVVGLDDYFKAHLGSYWQRPFPSGRGGEFERVVCQVLEQAVDELTHGIQAGGALDIDIALRCGNQVGIAEVKTGAAARRKTGLDQLNTAARREYLGIYTRKFLIVDTAWNHTLSNLRDLADVSEIKVIELSSYGQTGSLLDQDRERLVREVAETLGCW